MSDLLLSFFGDDFTGSTDALESLARAGIRTILFTRPPTPGQLAAHPDLRAFGVAGMTRALPPDEMERVLAPALALMRRSGAPIVHYKVCSTFDSSPTVGSIGRAIDIGARIFDRSLIPVIAAAPALGRYCVFGNLFARCGTDPEIFRIDRHPSMSRHPTTPMNEGDLRRHLARQTDQPIALIDVLAVDRGEIELERINEKIVLIDLLHERQLPAIGRALQARASEHKPLFVVGSSAVESALAAHWNLPQARFEPIKRAAPVLVVSGSRSPVTDQQITHARDHAGFVAIPADQPQAASEVLKVLKSGRSAIVHTLQMESKARASAVLPPLVRAILETIAVHRVIVAGGDTSGEVAQALGIESMEMIGELARGSPLVRVAAPGSPADGIEMTFKGGQIGPVDFFSMVEKGTQNG